MNTDAVWCRLCLGTWVTALVFAAVPASSQDTSGRPCAKPDEYEQVLDSYFAHARGSNTSAVVLRVYGGLSPEYELVLDPAISNHSVVWYEPKQSIWGGAYDGLFASKHRAIQEYVSRALKIPLTKQEIKISEAEFSAFVARAANIDTSLCEHLPLKDSKGNEHLIHDVPWLEVILDGGSRRSKITDTSDFNDIVSQNPFLLLWATDVQKILRDRRARPRVGDL